MRLRIDGFYLPAVVMALVCSRSNADVSVPTPPPPPPAGYCSTIFNELHGYLDAFNQTLGTPAPYPTVQIAQLQMADSNTGPAITGPNYLNSVMTQVQELQAMGFQGVKVEVAFPVLYEPFFGSADAMAPYLAFYTQLAQNLKTMGMKLVVENNVLMSTGTEAGWPNVGPFYDSLDWNAFIAARATMAGTVAQAMQPDFLMLSEEPDTEAANSGQPNLNTPSFAAAMIAGEITAARNNSMTAKLGAGFGTWLGPYEPNGLTDYLNAYVALPLDYIDMHIYPINTEFGGLSNFLDNALVVWKGATAAKKPVAISESWPWKMEDSEFNVLTPDTFRARNPFGFWGPIDTYFIQTMENLSNYTQMLYLTSQGNDYFQTYQTYGGTTGNGGAANCTCTTATCSAGDISSQENIMAANAGQVAGYTSTAFFYNSLLVTQKDTIAPTAPSALSGIAAYNSASLSWAGSQDNIGVAGYNIYRCSPPPCTVSWVANSGSSTYWDSGLNDNTTYTYQVQAFDLMNNHSEMSNPINLTTALNTPPDAPTNTQATAVSPKEIDVIWSPPANSTGLTKYVVSAGPLPNMLLPIATVPATTTSFRNTSLTALLTYYYGVEAVEQGLNSPMSPIASATTMPLPNTPNSVTATPVAANKITVAWHEAPQPGGLPVANYQVYEGTQDGVFSKVGTTTATTYTATSLTPGTTYYFYVIAVDQSYDDSAPSYPVSATTLAPPAAPSALQGSAPAASKITLSWQWAPAPGGLPLSHFAVTCNSAAGPVQGSALGNSYTYTKAAPMTPYSCSVVAVDTGNDSSPPSSNANLVTPQAPDAPSAVQATATSSTNISMSWSEAIPPGGLAISRYSVYCATLSGASSLVGTAQTNSFTYRGALPATQYNCYVVAIDTGNDTSPASATVGAVTPPLPASPTSLQATAASATMITFSWLQTVPAGGLPVSKSQVYCGTAPGLQPLVGTTQGTTFTYRTATPATRYACYVVAVDTGGDSSPPSSNVGVATPPSPDAPANLQASASSATKFTISWSQSIPTGGLPIARSQVYCGTPGSGQSLVGTVLGQTFTYTSATAATRYACYVVAVDTGGDDSTASSNVGVATPPFPGAPASVQVSLASGPKVRVSWTETVPAGGLPIARYKIYRSTTTPVTTADYLATRTTATYSDTAVVSGTTYYYAVAAVDSGQDTSSLSDTSAGITPP